MVDAALCDAVRRAGLRHANAVRNLPNVPTTQGPDLGQRVGIVKLVPHRRKKVHRMADRALSATFPNHAQECHVDCSQGPAHKCATSAQHYQRNDPVTSREQQQ